MALTQLGYLGVQTTDLEQWRNFAVGFLGMHVNGENVLTVRMDDRAQRLLILPGDAEGLAFLGFEVEDAEALETLSNQLTSAGHVLTPGTDEEIRLRQVDNMVSLQDPDGNRVEIYFGPHAAKTPFSPGRPIGGFRTDTLGVGHITLTTPEFERAEAFYRDLLEFQLSDFISKKPFRASFFHINARHHTLAVIEAEKVGVHHVMFEYVFMDDVGRLYDMAQDNPESIAVTLGRHSNDHMFSFYSYAPGGAFLVETGWGGRLVDTEHKHQPVELYGPSIWGHERHWLPEAGRRSAKEKLIAAAKEGILEPTEVNTSDAFSLKRLPK